MHTRAALILVLVRASSSWSLRLPSTCHPRRRDVLTTLIGSSTPWVASPALALGLRADSSPESAQKAAYVKPARNDVAMSAADKLIRAREQLTTAEAILDEQRLSLLVRSFPVLVRSFHFAYFCNPFHCVPSFLPGRGFMCN